MLWPDTEADAARGKLRRHLHLLLAALPPAAGPESYITATMQTVRWNPLAPATVDVIAFADAARKGRFDEATVWYAGDFLESFFDDWIVAERERLRAAQLDVLRNAVARFYGSTHRTLDDVVAAASPTP